MNYIKKQLKAMQAENRDKMVIRKFAENYLRRDGLFLVRMISKNAGELTAVEILCGLWDNYGPKQRLLTETLYKPSRKSVHGKDGACKMEIV